MIRPHVRKIVSLAAVALSLLQMTTLAHADPIITSNIIYDTSPPANLSQGKLQDNTHVFLIPEQQAVFLSSPGVFVDIETSNSGALGTTFHGNTDTSSVRGTLQDVTVNSYLFHFDGDGTAKHTVSDATATFDTQILGVIFVTRSLDNSDAAVGLSGETYSNSSARGLEPNDNFVLVSGDGKSIHINLLTTTSEIDEIRVLTAVAPEPGSLTLLGLGVVTICGYGWRRRK